MDMSELADVTLLDNEAREAAAIKRGWMSLEQGFAGSLRSKTKAEIQKTSLVNIGTVSVSPVLRDAILGLHRDDPLRRTYLRRWWTKALTAESNND